MPLSKGQIRLLEFLPMNEWFLYRDCPEGTSRTTVLRLIEIQKLEGVVVLRPGKLTDEEVRLGKFERKIVPFTKNYSWPDFVKKVDDTYTTEAENRVAILEGKVVRLEKIIAEFAPNLTKKET